MSAACAPLSADARGEAEHQALAAVVAEVLADPRPDVPHEEVQTEILRDLAEMLRRQKLPCPPRPVLDCRHG